MDFPIGVPDFFRTAGTVTGTPRRSRGDEILPASTHGRLPIRARQRAIVARASSDRPFGWPRKCAAILAAPRHDAQSNLRSGRKNGFPASRETKVWLRNLFSCKSIVPSRYAGPHQFSRHKKQEQSRFPIDTVWCHETHLFLGYLLLERTVLQVECRQLTANGDPV